jgi:hypothetical protein
VRGPAVRRQQMTGAGEGEEGLVDVVALNVVRRTTAYSCRLRLFDGCTLTARPVVITPALPADGVASPRRPFGRKL